MTPLTPTSLKALRCLLFFTPAEAARWIAVTPDNPDGISEETWLEWETGVSASIPEAVVDRIRELSDWRSTALAATADNIRAQIKEKGGLPESITIIWYDSLEDWLSLPGREPVMWRLQQSVCAGLMGLFSIVRMVAFDRAGYAEWLEGREDSEALRAEWAARA